MWRMGLSGGDGGEGDGARLPERPGEADCIYYLRTGACGFGDRCRYNHPRDRGGTEVSVSQPPCFPRYSLAPSRSDAARVRGELLPLSGRFAVRSR